MPVWAKFCSECGKPLNEGAKFCSECGAGVGNVGKTESQKSNELLIIKDKLDCMEEFCIYFESSNKKTCMEKFPDCKFRFNKGLEELSREKLADNQKALIKLYKYKWTLVEESYNSICENNFPRSNIYYISKVNEGINKALDGASIIWIDKFIDLCKSCRLLVNTNFRVTSNFLDSSNGKSKSKNRRIMIGSTCHIYDVKNDKFFVEGETYGYWQGKISENWIDKEQVYKRTNFKKRPNLNELVEQIERKNKELELLDK